MKKFRTETDRELHRLASARGQFESFMIMAHKMRGILDGRAKFLYANAQKVREQYALQEKAIREGELEGTDAERYNQLDTELSSHKQ